MKFAFYLVLTLALLSLTVSVHETAHSVAAVAQGVTIQEIKIGLPIGPLLNLKFGTIPVSISPWVVWEAVFVDQSKIEQLSYGGKLAIYLAGPLVNIILGMLLPTISLKKEEVPSGPIGPRGVFKISIKTLERNNVLQGSLAVFQRSSLGIGIFNLIPIFPLDGGRIMETIAQAAFGAENIAIFLIIERLFGISVLLIFLLRSIFKD